MIVFALGMEPLFELVFLCPKGKKNSEWREPDPKGNAQITFCKIFLIMILLY